MIVMSLSSLLVSKQCRRVLICWVYAHLQQVCLRTCGLKRMQGQVQAAMFVINFGFIDSDVSVWSFLECQYTVCVTCSSKPEEA